MAITRMNNNMSALSSTIGTISWPGIETHVAMNWWQWSSGLATATDETPWSYAGDEVCQSGISQTSPQCGTLRSKTATKNYTSSAIGLWTVLHDMYRTDYNRDGGDSGGTVWIVKTNGDRLLSGIHHGVTGGQPIYTWVGELKNYFGLQAPVGMS